MANEEVLGPRKTMFVLVIVVGCFAVLWPRILSPLMLGQAQLKPNQFDRDAGVKQERSPTRGAGPHPALRERGRAIPAGAPTPPSRGPVLMPPHARVRSPLSVYFDGDIKPPPIPGMRPPLGSPGGPVPAPKSSMGFVMPIYTICIIVFFVYTLSKILFKRTGSVPYEHVAPDPQFRRRVFRDDSRSTPDSKLGPKERDARDVELEALRARLEETERAMQRIVGQLAKRDAVGPVLWTPFGTSRSTLSDIVVTAISGLVAEVHQQMEANYAQSQQRQDSQENHTRPYTNGSVHSSPIIIASEYETKEKTPEPEKAKEASPEPELTQEKQPASEPETHKEAYPEPKEPSPEIEPTPEPEKLKEASPEPKQPSPEKESTSEPETRKESSPETKEPSPEIEPIPESEKHKKASPEPKQPSPEKQPILEPKEQTPELEREATPKPSPEKELSLKPSPEESEESLDYEREPNHIEEELLKLTEDIKEKKENLAKSTEEFLNDAREKSEETEELLREALKEESPVKEVTEEEDEEGSEPDNVSVKVVGMELTASGAPAVAAAPAVASAPARSLHDESKQHEAEEVTSIFLDTHIPQQSRVLVADFEDRAKPRRHEPTVVSGKMTLSLIQDEPRDTPERDPESTVDDFTTASAMTQPVAEKEGQSSDEEVEEEIEIEEIEEEVEDEEEEESRKTQN